MNKFAGKTVIIAALFYSSISFCSALDDESSALRIKCISNIESIRTVKFSAVTNIEPAVAINKAQVRVAPAGSDAVTWDRKGIKCKWKRSGSGASGYVVDAVNGTLSYLGPDSASVFVEDIPVSDALEKSVPSPRWLWNPSWLIPEKPASVRKENGIVIITTSNGNPKREIRMEAGTGHLLGFTDTDAKGNTVRVVEVKEWVEYNGVWLPGSVREEIRGSKGILVRNTILTVSAVNDILGATDFVLP